MPRRPPTWRRACCRTAGRPPVAERVLVIACGALAREIVALKRKYAWHHLDMQCIDARLHNRPALIADRVRQKIRDNRDRYDRIFVAYGDCGTGGQLDRVLAEEQVERLPGAHCYQFLAGNERFDALADSVPGTFYLTDFLARHFDRLVMKPLKLDTHSELRDAYFGNYTRLVYLSQTKSADLEQRAKQAARRLGLAFEHVHCGYGALQQNLNNWLEESGHGQEDTRLLA
ncbi:MAG: DUF1638 domain-containing protein [Gammaproteobacteria bacterium]|nr:DUF1638 domain-containing protein [Gammaproteobacteria bacterium]